MQRALQLLTAAALVACAGAREADFVGQTIGDYDNLGTGAPSTPSNSSEALGVLDDAGTCGGDNDVPQLLLTGGVDSIDASHVAAFTGSCCVDWTVLAELDAAAGAIVVAYAAGGTETCDCECSHTLDYTLTDVPAGSWTVVAAGLAAQVVVGP